MKKILLSIMVVGLCAILLGAGTLSFFSDWEVSEDNLFEAGQMDLLIDCHSTHMRTFPVDGLYDDYEVELPITFEEKDLVPGDYFFNWHDVKPGDYGEATISFHVWDNDAWMWFRLTNLAEGPGETPEPEEEFNPDNGELAENIHVMLWVDDGDNIFEPDQEEVAFFEGTLLELADMDWFGEWHLIGCELFYIGWEWNVPTSVGNIIQGDWVEFDVEIYTEQYRNNPDPVPPENGDPFEGYLHDLQLRVLNGLANDSFDVYVDDTLVYQFTDGPSVFDFPVSDLLSYEALWNLPQIWCYHNISLLPFLIPWYGPTHVVKVVATGDQWIGFEDYGQLVVSEMTLFCDEDEYQFVNLGDDLSEAGHNLLGWWDQAVGEEHGVEGYGDIDSARVAWYPANSDEPWASVDFTFL